MRRLAGLPRCEDFWSLIFLASVLGYDVWVRHDNFRDVWPHHQSFWSVVTSTAIGAGIWAGVGAGIGAAVLTVLIVIIINAGMLPRPRLAEFSVTSLTNLAALLVGSRRPALRAEWRAYVAGESGHDPATLAHDPARERAPARAAGRPVVIVAYLVGLAAMLGGFAFFLGPVVFPALRTTSRQMLPFVLPGFPEWWLVGALGGAAVVTLERAVRSASFRSRLQDISVSGLTDLAALLAGHRRPELRDEWHAHLGGESGHDPITWPNVRQALGFVAAAIKLRLADAADAAWTPADAILKSRKLSNLVVFGPTALAALFILRRLGTLGVLTSAESIVAIGGALYALIRIGRWWRNVKPPEPKARCVAETDDVDQDRPTAEG